MLAEGAGESAANRIRARGEHAQVLRDATALRDAGKLKRNQVVVNVERNGVRSTGRSGPDNPNTAHPLVEDAYRRSVPEANRTRTFLKCGEVPSLSGCINRTGGTRGATSTAAQSTGGKTPPILKEACRNCAPSLRSMGVRDTLANPGLPPLLGEDVLTALRAGRKVRSPQLAPTQ